MGVPFPLDFQPGIVKVDAPYALRGRYIDCDKVRFKDGKPEKWLGWDVFGSTVLGVPRALESWDDFSDARWLAIGTHKKLYLTNSIGTLSNITPIEDTGTLANNPFAMVNTLTLVTVTDVAHARTLGSTVSFSGATAAGGITINGEYLVNTVLTADTYTIIHSAPATSTVSGGGAAVVYSYEINIGEPNVIVGVGYGTSTYGSGTYGTPRTNSNFLIYARIWSLATYGENLLAMPSKNYLYQWDPDTPTVPAAKVTNSPTGNFMFMTNERYPVVLGADGDNMALRWPDQNDITNWTPSSTSTANTRRLGVGSRIVAGANLAGTINCLWTDDAFYSMNYTGQRNFVYNTLIQGKKCGLIGPHAFAVVDGIAYWMSNFNFFTSGGSAVSIIRRSHEIRKWLFDQLDDKQNWKAAAHYSSQHNEVRWNFVLDGQLEPALYVAVSLDDFSWTHGMLNRTAWVEKSGINSHTYATDENGVIYEHEVGLNASGAAMSWYLESAPIDANNGASAVDIWGYIPNFQRQVGDITLTLKTWDMPQHTAVQETFSDTISVAEGIIDVHMSGRQVSVKMAGSAVGGDFRLGLSKLEVSEAGSRRGSP